MSLSDFAKGVPGLLGLSHADKVKHFGWYLHTERQKESFKASDVKECYDALHYDPPANLPRTLDALTEKKPPELLKKTGGLYRLHANVRAPLDAKYGKPDLVIKVEKNVGDLPGKLTDPAEQLFLEETLKCYRHTAYRAAIVMAWNLAYGHLLTWVLADEARLAAFNQGILARNSRKADLVVSRRDDFEKLKENEVVDIVSKLSGITDNMKRVLKEKLARRNMYAHPSSMHAERQHVDEMVLDLVNNIVLKLPC